MSTKVGQLSIRKIINTIATRWLKCTKFDSWARFSENLMTNIYDHQFLITKLWRTYDEVTNLWSQLCHHFRSRLF